jgi:hypothetical protein
MIIEECVYKGGLISIGNAVTLRDKSPKLAKFACPHCGEPVRAHRQSKAGARAHFEHYEKNQDCPARRKE